MWENGLETWEMAEISLRYVVNGFTILEMALEFDKRLIYVANDVYM